MWESIIGRVLRRERIAVLGALLVVIVLSWTYLLYGAGMSGHRASGMVMPVTAAQWTPAHAVMVLVMWSVMMAAMMLPSAAPMILLYDTIARRRRQTGGAAIASGTFAFAYLAVWTAFSVAAVALQFGLESAALLSPVMQIASATIAGALLIAGGLYQWTPLKQACLRRCRSPLDFVMTHWREGRRGAFVMGMQHGVYCVGCCWMLMLLLFAVGVMNLVWISALAALIFVEKLAPSGHRVSRVTGTVLIVSGAAAVLAA